MLKMMRRQRGVSMFEIIIGTALMGTLMAGAIALANRSNNETTGRNKADELQSFQQLAGQYFVANRTEMEAAMGGNTAQAAVHCRLNVPSSGTGGTTANNATKRTCAFDATLLRVKGVWPVGLPVDLLGGTQRYVAIARQIMTTTGTPAPTGASEMIIVLAPVSGGSVLSSGSVAFTGEKKRAMEEVSAGMAALGGAGGYIPPGSDFANCQYNNTTKQVCGTGWVVSLNDFIN